ncbi:MAG TPA: glycine cleavage system protein H, partial [Opitutus sp.]|nr:glycine cleavage system protein H [Opitutus sp.]
AVGATLTKGQTFGVVESVKAASDLYAPVSGTVLEANATLNNMPETLNREPYGEGWMLKIRLSNAGEAGSLLDAEGYAKSVE